MELKPSSMVEKVGAYQAKEITTTKIGLEKSYVVNESKPGLDGSANGNSSAPVTKTQVIGCPPIRSFGKNSLAFTSKNVDVVDGKMGSRVLFVKVSLDGAPYLRNVDLKNYSFYINMISGPCGSHGKLGKEMLSETKLRDLLHGLEYVLTYKDKDGDWMLLGDVLYE
ncbi:hypothetical protein RJT34_07516 [Clitoria ternatea]|uniref:Auxin-induced protein n=1 Tax=Clitoria ternatea TaxID=43366 RepID=A0AAN9K6M9_CLITE